MCTFIDVFSAKKRIEVGSSAYKWLTKDEIIENYGHLWKIEKAFRVSKHDLKISCIFKEIQSAVQITQCCVGWAEQRRTKSH
jgi:hypothetical protein